MLHVRHLHLPGTDFNVYLYLRKPPRLISPSPTSKWTLAASVGVWVVGVWRRSAERPEHFYCQDGDIGAGKRDKRVLKNSINVHGDRSHNFSISSTLSHNPASLYRNVVFWRNYCVSVQGCVSSRGSLLALACTAMWWIRQCLTLLAGRDWLYGVHSNSKHWFVSV